MTERRRFVRFDTTLSALCEIASEKLKASSKVMNISKEGALLLLNRKLKEGADERHVNVSSHLCCLASGV